MIEFFMIILAAIGTAIASTTAWWQSINWGEIQEGLTISLGVLSAVLTLICLIIKLNAARKASTAEEKKELFYDLVLTAVIEAEKHSNYSGVEKKAYAETRIKRACKDNKVSYTDEALDEAIEAAISLSKNVNKK